MIDVAITTVPSADDAFRVHVETAHARLPGGRPELLQAELRKAYPNARVEPGSALGSLGVTRRLYVYRDGTPSARADDRWWTDESLPTTVVGDDGRYVDANASAEELFGVPKRVIVGAPSGSFSRHEENPVLAARLFETLRHRGELASTATVVRPDGEEIPIEFHMRRLAGSDRYMTVMRAVQRGTPDHGAGSAPLGSTGSPVSSSMTRSGRR